MAPRGNVDAQTREQIFSALKETWFSDSAQLAKKLSLDTSTVSSALTAYTQAGRVIYDLNLGVYRVRELSREPLNPEAFRFGSDREKLANELLDQDNVKVSAKTEGETIEIKGTVKANKRYTTLAVLDSDERLINANCECDFFRSNALRMGPCEHILATRMAFHRQKKS